MRLRILLCAVLGALAIFVSPTPAEAHANLSRADPPPGATLPATPGRIRLEVTEPVNRLSRLTLLGPGGVQVEIGETTARGTSMEAAVGALPPGAYTVRWGIISLLDGHLTAGSYQFRIGKGTLSESAGTEGFWSITGRAMPRLLLICGALLWMGSVLLSIVVVGRPGKEAAASLLLFVRLLRTVGAPAAGAAAVGEIWTLALVSAAGVPVWSSAFFFGSSPGRFTIARIGVLAIWIGMSAASLGGGLARLNESLRRRALWQRFRGAASDGGRWGLLLPPGAYLSLLAMSGHASIAPAGRVSGPLADGVHLVAAAAWLGGIAVLGFGLRARRISADPETVATVARRFSPIALASAVILALTGMIATEQQTLGFSDLAGTLYGQILIAKLILVALLIGMSFEVGFRLRPALVGATRGAEAAALASRLLTRLRLEAPVALAIIVCVSLMTSIASPRTVVAAESRSGAAPPPAPVFANQPVGDGDISLAILPGSRGPNTVTVSVEGLNVDRAELRFDRVGAEGIAFPLTSTDALFVSKIDFPSGGQWNLRVATPAGDADFRFAIGDPASAKAAVQVTSVADLRGPARDRCRDAIIGQQIAFAAADSPPVVQLVFDRDTLAKGGGPGGRELVIPGHPSVLLDSCDVDSDALRAVSESRQLPFVSAGKAAPGNWSWSIDPEPDIEGKTLARLSELLQARRSVVLYEDTEWHARAANAFGAAFSALGGRADLVRLSAAVDGALSLVSGAAPDLLVLLASTQPATAAARELDRRGWRPGRGVFAGTGLLGPEILDAAPGWRDAGLLYMATPLTQDVRFVAPYTQGVLGTFPGERPSLRGLEGFIKARLLLEAVRDLGRAPAPAEIGRSLDARFRDGWPLGSLDVTWRPGDHTGARQFALYWMTPPVNIFALMPDHTGHASGGLLYSNGDVQQWSPFYGPDGPGHPVGAETPG